jgi:hypothetical protein
MPAVDSPEFRTAMASVPKGLSQPRPPVPPPTLQNTRSAPRDAGVGSAHRPSTPARRTGAASDSLRDLLAASLWPMVSAAFRNAEDDVDARFYQLGDLQVVISRAPVRGALKHREAERLVTLEVWPAAGPRLLEVEWSGSRPYVRHRREGDWLPRLIRASRQFD